MRLEHLLERLPRSCAGSRHDLGLGGDARVECGVLRVHRVVRLRDRPCNQKGVDNVLEIPVCF
jgi:hypothetical protein